MRALCPRCQRPSRACLCAWITPMHNRLPLLVLQHPQEASQAKGTLRLLLYPDSPAAPVAATGALPRPQRLVLLDGTWRQARGLLRANPLLQALPRWALPSPAASRYVVRQAHHPAQRSTLEAACAALAWLEDRPAHYAPLLQAFSAWQAQLLQDRSALSAARPAAGS